jgi:hypothetical protein
MITYHYLKFFVQVFIFQDLRIIKILIVLFGMFFRLCFARFVVLLKAKAKANKDYQVFEVIQVYYKFTSKQITFTVCQVSSFPK